MDITLNAWIDKASEVKVSDASWSFTENKITLDLGRAGGTNLTVWLTNEAADEIVAALGNLRAAQTLVSDDEIPFDLRPEWVEVDEDGVPIPNDDADYIREIL